MDNTKQFIGCMYLKDQKAVKSLKDYTVLSEHPLELAREYNECDMDSLIIFDLADDPIEHDKHVELIQTICQDVRTDIYAGGHIQTKEDAAVLLDNGCSKVILNLGKNEGQDLLQNLGMEYGRERILSSICSEDSIVINKAGLECFASALVLMDENALKNCLGASSLPCIVFLPEVSLDKMLYIMQRPNVCGISGNIVNENAKEIFALKSICSGNQIPVRMFEPAIPFSELKLLSDGLIPVVVQDYRTKQVLMVAYMNEEAYLKTIKSGKMTYYSRSRKELWVKGLTSGHFQYVKSLSIDCDNDTLLASVEQIGAACHTGNYSCFYRDIIPARQDTEDSSHVFDQRLALKKAEIEKIKTRQGDTFHNDSLCASYKNIMSELADFYSNALISKQCDKEQAKKLAQIYDELLNITACSNISQEQILHILKKLEI